LLLKKIKIRKLSTPPSTWVDPLTLWQTHEGQFPNIAFLAKQILGILGFHIETKRVFNLVGVLMRRSCLQVKILIGLSLW
jgi:hypothetical protein